MAEINDVCKIWEFQPDWHAHDILKFHESALQGLWGCNPEAIRRHRDDRFILVGKNKNYSGSIIVEDARTSRRHSYHISFFEKVQP